MQYNRGCTNTHTREPAMAKSAKTEKPDAKLVAIQTKLPEDEVAMLDQARREFKSDDGDIPSRAELMRIIVRDHLKAQGIKAPRR